MIKLSANAPKDLTDLYGTESCEIVAQETRDGIGFVSVAFQGVELCGIPASWIEAYSE